MELLKLLRMEKTVKRYKFKKALPAEMIPIPVEAGKAKREKAPLEVKL